ncbi:MAG TPA: SCP-2 sterol transfer family protein [Gammaproteobacteria bacterium]|nr:SCP-2 sterol transfer family protein [Gammaproteobacteria bacterium]
MPKFLTEEWFEAVDKLREDAGEMEVPEELEDLKLNLVVTGAPAGDQELSIVSGAFERQKSEDAPATITVPYEICQKLFIEQDRSVAMQAFMSGEIKIDGDMSKLMSLQSMQNQEPSEAQQQLQEKIREITEI